MREGWEPSWRGRQRGGAAPPSRGLWTIDPVFWDPVRDFNLAGGGGEGG